MTHPTAFAGWEPMDIQLCFDYNEGPFVKRLLRIPRWDEVVAQVVEWLLHKPGRFEEHDLWVEIVKKVGSV